MTGTTRRSVLATVGVGLASAGCLSHVDDGTGDPTGTDQPTTEKTTRDESTGTADGTRDGTPNGDGTTGDWIEQASNSPDPDHEIVVEGEASGTRTLHIEVVRESTGEAVFETTEAVTAGEESAVYNLRDADPEGVESFRVCAELAGETTTTGTISETDAEDSSSRDCVTIATNECYGNARVTLTDDGGVEIIYAIC